MLWNDWKQDKNQQMRSDKQAEKGGWYQPALRCSRHDERSPAHTHTHIYAVSRFNLRVAPLICLDEENAYSKKKKKKKQRREMKGPSNYGELKRSLKYAAAHKHLYTLV